MLILYTGGNTSFNGFPFLTSYVAGDSFLPRWLLKRGHRLVFSNAIILLDGHLGGAADHQGRGRQQPGAAVRDRRVHRVHDGRLRHGQVPSHAPRAGLARTSSSINFSAGALSLIVVDHLRGGEVHRGRLGGARAVRDPRPRADPAERRVPGRDRGARDGQRRAAAARRRTTPGGSSSSSWTASTWPRWPRCATRGRCGRPDPRRALRHRQPARREAAGEVDQGRPRRGA